MEVSVIIPIIKEPYVNKLIKRIHRSLEKTEHEIIVVELIPKDENPSKIKDAIYVRQKSKGLGKAVLEGFKHAKGKYIITIDGDGSHRPEDIPKLLDAMKNYDIVIGSRFMKGGKTKDSSHRKLISLSYRYFANAILGLKLKDPMSGFASAKRKIYEKINKNQFNAC